MKRTIIFILTLAMLVSAIPFSASGETSTLNKDGDGFTVIESYEDLYNDLLDHQGSQHNMRYRLYADIYESDNLNSRDLFVNYCTVEFDLNGHTLSRSTGGKDTALFAVYNDAYMTVYDSSASKTGALEYNNTYLSNGHLISCSNSTLVIESGNYRMKSKGNIILCEGSTLLIYGGNFEGTGSNTMGLGVRRTLDSSPAPNVMIYDAVFHTNGKTIDVYKDPLHSYGDSQYPFVAVLGGEYYTDAEAGFSYIANAVGKVVSYGGIMAWNVLNPKTDLEFARGTERTVETLSGTKYYFVSSPNWLITDGESAYARFSDAAERYVLSSIPTNSNFYKENHDIIDAKLASPCALTVGERKTSPLVLSLYNMHSDVKKLTLCCSKSLAADWDASPWEVVGEIENPAADASFTVERPLEKCVRYYRLRIKFTDETTWDDYIAVNFEEAKFTMEGTPYPSMNNVRYGNTLFCAINGFPENIPVDSLKFEWMVDGKVIGTERKVKLDNAEWVGKHLTVRVTSTAADGAIVSSPVKIDKAYNKTTPAFPRASVKMSGDNLSSVKVTGIQTDQEYLFTKKLAKDLTKDDWEKSFTYTSSEYECSRDTLSSEYGVDAAKGDTLYVYTRFTENVTTHAGTTIVSAQVLVNDVVWLQSITFPDAVNGYLFIPYTGGSDTYNIRYDLNPSNATSGGNIQWSASSPLSVVFPTSSETVSGASGYITVKPNAIGGSNLRAFYMTYMENLYGQVNVILYDPNNVTAGYLRPVTPLDDATVYVGTGYAATIPEFIISPTSSLTYRWYFTQSTQQGYKKMTETEFASIDPTSGEITTSAPGKVTVSLYADDYMVDSYELTVIEKPDNYVALEALYAETSEMTVKVGEKRQIKLIKSPASASVDQFTFSSSAPGVAYVSKDGTVNAVSKGTAVITAIASGEGVSTTVKITVVDGAIGDVLLGDVNGDGKINSRDVIMIMKAVIAENAGGEMPVGFIREAADVKADGKLNSRDVIEIMKLVIEANAGK